MNLSVMVWSGDEMGIHIQILGKNASRGPCFYHALGAIILSQILESATGLDFNFSCEFQE